MRYALDHKPNCLLCGSLRVEEIELLSATDLNDLYDKQYGIYPAVRSQWLSYWRCHECDLGFFDPTETGDERLYSSLQEHDWYYLNEKWEYEVAMRYMSAEDSVLEVGAGRAAFAKRLAPNRYRGLEFNDTAIQTALVSGIQLAKESIEDHASAGNVYDAVVSFQVLEHVPDPASFLRSCADCLKPNGRLILAVPAHDGFLGRAVNNALNLPPHHATHWTASTLQSIARLFGLELVEIVREPLAEYHSHFARKVMMEAKMRHLLRLEPRLLDRRWLTRCVAKAASLAVTAFRAGTNRLEGHSIVAIYAKPN